MEPKYKVVDENGKVLFNGIMSDVLQYLDSLNTEFHVTLRELPDVSD